MPTITPDEARKALALPREPGKRSVTVNGLSVSVCTLNRIARHPAQPAIVAPVTSGVVPLPPTPTRARLPVTERPDSERVEISIIDKVQRFESNANPIRLPDYTLKSGEHIKSYIINFIDKQGNFHVEKVSAKGIVTAISMFYIQHEETAIVSVICVL